MIRAAVALLLWAIAVGAQCATFLQYGSQLGDPAGQGASATYTDSQATFSISASSGDVVVQINGIAPLNFAGKAEFHAAPGATLSVGSYPLAYNVGASAPTMGVTVGGAACSFLYGKFTILELTTGPGPVQFAADFEQHCNNIDPVLYGSIRVNSAVPANVLPPIPAGPAFFQFVSMPNDYVGGGQSFSLGRSDGFFSVAMDSAGTGVQALWRSVPAGTLWNLSFAPAPGGTLGVGTYTDTRRYHGNAPGIHPTLDVSGDARGCNTSIGRFTVLEIEAGPVQTLSKLAVDFEQHCNGAVDALFGSLRYNSTIPFTQPTIPQVATQLLRVGGSAQIGVINGQPAPGVQVLAVDANAQPVPGMPVNFAVAGICGFFQGVDPFPIVLTDSNGVAAAPAYVPFGLGSCTVTATMYTSSTLVVSTEYLAFDGSQMLLAPLPSSSLTLEAAQQFQAGVSVTVQGHTIAYVPATFSQSGAAAGVLASSLGTQASTGVDGNAYVSGVAGTVAGQYTIGISVQGATSRSIAVTQHAAPVAVVPVANLSVVRGNNQPLGPGDTAPVNFGVSATDSHGNPVAGATVRFSSTCGTFAGAASIDAITDASGVASAGSPFVAGTNATACQITATVVTTAAPASTTLTSIIYDPASLVITSNPSSITTLVSHAFSSTLRVTTGTGLALPNVEFVVASTSTSGSAPANLPSNTFADATGTATLAGVANAVAGTYQIRVRFDARGPTLVIPVTQQPSSAPPPPFTETVVLQDMWWNPSENGWGMSLIQHQDTLFAALYIYDAGGNPTWLVMPGGTWDSTHLVYTGSLYTPAGTPFFSYDATREVVGNPKGTLAITFQDANDAILDYTIGGLTGRKSITREIFANGAGTKPNRTDLWWGGIAQNGWGITILQQADTLFPIWFTYDANGKAMWYVMPVGNWTASDTYSGTVYRTTGSPWVGASYDPTKVVVTQAGTYSIQFNGDAATFAYTVDGHSGTIPLVKEPF